MIGICFKNKWNNLYKRFEISTNVGAAIAVIILFQMKGCVNSRGSI